MKILPTCNGLCITASDIGIEEYGNMIAYAHPDCEKHGDGQDEYKDAPMDERYFADYVIDSEGVVEG